jgi:hypothetical protein
MATFFIDLNTVVNLLKNKIFKKKRRLPQKLSHIIPTNIVIIYPLGR